MVEGLKGFLSLIGAISGALGAAEYPKRLQFFQRARAKRG